MKRLFLLLFVSCGMYSFLPPKKSEKEKKKELPKFVKDARKAFKNDFSKMLEKGQQVSVAELDLLTSMESNTKESRENIDFWVSNGILLLIHGQIQTDPVSLVSQAAKVVSEDKKLKKYAEKVLPEDLKLRLLGADQSKLKDHFKKVLGKFDSKQLKSSNFESERARRIQLVQSVWNSVLTEQNTLFLQHVLKNLLEIIEDSKLPNPKDLVNFLIDSLVAKQCENVQAMVAYLKTKNFAEFKNRIRRRFVELQQNMPEGGRLFEINSNIFAQLLDSSPKTCPALVRPMLMMYLGSKATKLLGAKP